MDALEYNEQVGAANWRLAQKIEKKMVHKEEKDCSLPFGQRVLFW